MNKMFVLFALAFFIGACTTEPVPSEPVPSEPDLGELCVQNGGTWLEEFNECEGISEQACTELGGTFNDCASACRNNPEAEFCTLQCVAVCEFE